MKKSIVIMIFSAAFIVSCGPKSTAVTGPKFSSAENLAQGKTVFLKIRATDATNYRILQSMMIQRWIKTLSRMAPKAKLTDEQHQMVYDYLISMNKK